MTARTSWIPPIPSGVEPSRVVFGELWGTMGVSAVGVEARIHDKIIILSEDRRFKEAVGKNKNQATAREALLRLMHFHIYFEASFCLVV